MDDGPGVSAALVEKDYQHGVFMPIDKGQLADVRKFLGAPDALTVRQGLELLQGLADRELWEVFAEGVIVTAMDTIEIPKGCEVEKRVKAAHRLEVALWALRGAGRLDAQVRLDLTGADLVHLESLAGLPRLERVVLKDCGALVDVAGLVRCPALKELRVEDCAVLGHLDGLKQGCSVEKVFIGGWYTLVNVDGLSGCASLRELSLRRCSALKNLDGLSGCAQLQTLELVQCTGLAHVDALSSCTSLRALTIDECTKLASVDGLSGCLQLETVAIDRCEALANLDGLSGCVSLRTLKLDNCGMVRDVNGLTGCGRLETLRARWCNELTNIDGLSGCASLRTLEIYGGRIEHADALSASLEDLSLSSDPLRNLDGLSSCTKLRTLKVYGRALESVDGVSGCVSLETLVIEGGYPGPTFTRIADLSRLASLQTLKISGCGKLVFIGGLSGCSALRTVELDAGLLTSVPDLYTRPSLQSADVHVDAAHLPVPVTPRELPAVEALTDEERTALKAVNDAIKAAKAPRDALPGLHAVSRATLLRVLGHARLRITDRGTIAYTDVLRFPRVTLEGDLLLALADIAGLLDDLPVLSLRGLPHFSDLGPLLRHADTLRWLNLRDRDERERWYFGEAKRAKLRDVAPMPAIAAPRDDAAIGKIVALLRPPESTRTWIPEPEVVARAAAIAVTHGQIDWLLERCTLSQDARSWRGVLTARVVPCAACSGTGRRGVGDCGSCGTDGRAKVSEDAAGAVLQGLLAAAPAGSRAAQGVVSKVVSLDVDAATLRWLHHFTALEKLTVSWADLAAHLPAVAKVPALNHVSLTGTPPAEAEAVELLRGLPHVTTVGFLSPVSLSLLAALELTSVTTATVALRGGRSPL